MKVVRTLAAPVRWVLDALFFVVCWPLALVARVWPKRIDIGLGPEPLVNNVYHKRALATCGYTAETFVDQVWYITSDFDYRGDIKLGGVLAPLRAYILFVRAIFRYRCLYIYFNGGPLASRALLWRLEPALYRLAGVRTVVMPYGGDVQVMSRSRNLWFKHAMAADYPTQRLRENRVARQIDLWTANADHVISGVEWVDYQYSWDTLMLGHFSIDVDEWERAAAPRPAEGTLRVFHAPNHRNIKGSDHFIAAVEELRAEGVDIELVITERVPNEVIRQTMAEVDVVADQLIVGWYAMFALEAMAMGRPVLCYLRQDLLDLYEVQGLLDPDEIPIVNCTPLTVKEALRALAADKSKLAEVAEKGRRFVRKHHSIEAIGSVFDRINTEVGIAPSGTPSKGR
jgi:glycosyltransferase involved in cell wall biosynthesis